MVNRIKQNNVSKRNTFKGNNREMMYSDALEKSTEYNFTTVTESQLKQLKIEITQKAKADQRKSIYILAIIIAIVALALWAFVGYTNVDPYTIAS